MTVADARADNQAFTSAMGASIIMSAFSELIEQGWQAHAHHRYIQNGCYRKPATE
jgi:hypothetical protein